MANVARRAKTAVKVIWRYANYHRVKTPIFVLGCQRSGTTLLLNVVGRSPKVHSYHEGERTILDPKDYRLISDDAIRKVVVKTPEPIVLLKPLNDSQQVDRLLALHSNAKAIWLYRHYREVVDSAVKMWGDAQTTMIREVSQGTYSDRGSSAIGERVTPENLKIVQRFATEGLSSWDGAALLWYLRNSIYFDASLRTNRRAMLFKYEDLVSYPEQKFGVLFGFIGAEFLPKYTADVHASSLKKESMFTFNPDIEALCQSMMARLDEAYMSQSLVQRARR
jgi:hypothetical protein